MNNSNFTPRERQIIEANIIAILQNADQAIMRAVDYMITGAMAQTEAIRQDVRNMWNNKIIRPEVDSRLPSGVIDAIVDGAWQRLEPRVMSELYRKFAQRLLALAEQYERSGAKNSRRARAD